VIIILLYDCLCSLRNVPEMHAVLGIIVACDVCKKRSSQRRRKASDQPLLSKDKGILCSFTKHCSNSNNFHARHSFFLRIDSTDS